MMNNHNSRITVVGNHSSRRATPPPETNETMVVDNGFVAVGGSESYEEEEEVSCPLCMELMDSSDCRFKPCPCGYQICRFCWHRIREEGNERCPACRRIYTDEDIEFLPVSTTPITNTTSTNKKRSDLKDVGKVGGSTTTDTILPSGILSSRRHLVELRVIQRNLVYVIGISARIAHENILLENEYFGQFGKILKIVVNRRNTGAPLPEKSGSAATTTSGSAYVTYAKAEEAARAISHVDGSVFDGRVLRATYGTTKYCSYFLRGSVCPNSGCMYLHEEGDMDNSFTKEELSSGKMQLHSSLVGPSESVGFRQFGTIMYVAPPRPSTPLSRLPPPTPSSPAQQPPPPSQTKPPAPPMVKINLEECEDETRSFLSRLNKWNRSSEFDEELDKAHKLNQQQQHAAFPEFDPFAPSIGRRPQSTSPIISTGALPGFNWPLSPPAGPVNGASSVNGGESMNDLQALFRKNPTPSTINTVRPTPVGFNNRPVDVPSTSSPEKKISSVAEQQKQWVESLLEANANGKEKITVNTNSNSSNKNQWTSLFFSNPPVSSPKNNNTVTPSAITTPVVSKKALDASQLEQEFFREPQPSLTPLAATPNNKKVQIKILKKTPIPATIETPVQKIIDTEISSSVGGGKKKVAPPPPIALARLKETINSPSVSVPNTPTNAATKKKSITNAKTSTTSNASTNIFSVLSNDLSSNSNSSEQSSLTPSEPTTPLKHISNNVIRKKSATAAGSVRRTSESTTNTLASRLPMPSLPSQPTYKLEWPTLTNLHYRPTPPTFSLMSPEERGAFRKWLESEEKANRIDLEITRTKVARLHSEMSNWFNNQNSKSTISSN